jgi:L-malate glycosyltransferase
LHKLLFVFNGPIFGGAERHTFDLAQGLLDLGFDVKIFAMKAGPLMAPNPVIMMQPAKPVSLKHRIFDLAQCIKQVQPDLIITVNERPVLASYIARYLTKNKIPIIAILHSTLLKSLKEKLMQLVYTKLLNRIESVVFISANQKKYWLGRNMKPRNDTVILNGINTLRFSPIIREQHRDTMRRSLGLLESDFVIGLSAVMRPEKNHLQAVRVLKKMHQQGVSAKLLFIGDGALRCDIEAFIHLQGLVQHVVFAGMQSDVRPYIAAFDVGVICSVSVETLSLSALEIMGMGVPMVMSDIGGASEIIDKDNGRLFAANNDDAFFEALMSFSLQETRDRAGNSAQLKVENIFDHSNMTKSYFNHLSHFIGIV